MITARRIFAFALFITAMFAIDLTAIAQVKVSAGDVEDSRRTDGFFNRLKVELKITGAALAGARGVRVSVDKAVDDTGKNLIDEKEQDRDFKEVDSAEAEVTIELKNPERRAASVREISGTVEVFAPQKDPKSILLVPGFQKTAGTPLQFPALKAAGIEVTFWTKEIFEARKKAEEERLKKELEEKTKRAESSQNPDDIVSALAEGLSQIFGGFTSSFASMEANDIAFNVKDPGSKLISIQFEDAQGKKIDHNGRMTIGSDPRTVIYNFEQKLPANARIRLFVLTPASVVKAPFNLTGVALP
jgi:hypothetical protein